MVPWSMKRVADLPSYAKLRKMPSRGYPIEGEKNEMWPHHPCPPPLALDFCILDVIGHCSMRTDGRLEIDLPYVRKNG